MQSKSLLCFFVVSDKGSVDISVTLNEAAT